MGRLRLRVRKELPRAHSRLAGRTGTQPRLLCGQWTPVNPASLTSVKTR